MTKEVSLVQIITTYILCIVNKAEIDVFLELSCFSYDPADPDPKLGKNAQPGAHPIAHLHACYHFSHTQLFATLWTLAHQAPLSMQEFPARILEWVAVPSSRGCSQPRD